MFVATETYLVGFNLPTITILVLHDDVSVAKRLDGAGEIVGEIITVTVVHVHTITLAKVFSFHCAYSLEKVKRFSDLFSAFLPLPPESVLAVLAQTADDVIPLTHLVSELRSSSSTSHTLVTSDGKRLPEAKHIH